MEKIVLKDINEALARVKELLNKSQKRIVIGIVGKPGAGKSTLTAHLINNLPNDSAALIPMDGYHLSNKQLSKLGLSDRKGAFNTFDSDGFVKLLKRVNEESGKDIYFPVFYREIEESYAADGVVPANTKLVITEGNYLLLDKGGWEVVRQELDEVWYIEVDDNLRLDRLTKRHQSHGRNHDEAFAWATGSDERNAELVAKTRDKADVIVEIN
jgi:pantothenate kinase